MDRIGKVIGYPNAFPVSVAPLARDRRVVGGRRYQQDVQSPRIRSEESITPTSRSLGLVRAVMTSVFVVIRCIFL